MNEHIAQLNEALQDLCQTALYRAGGLVVRSELVDSGETRVRGALDLARSNLSIEEIETVEMRLSGLLGVIRPQLDAKRAEGLVRNFDLAVDAMKGVAAYRTSTGIQPRSDLVDGAVAKVRVALDDLARGLKVDYVDALRVREQVNLTRSLVETLSDRYVQVAAPKG